VDASDQSASDRRRLTVAEAAEILGVSVEAVRGRIKRGTLDHERTQEGVFVLLAAEQETQQSGADQSPIGHQSDVLSGTAPLVEELHDRVRFLERMLEEEREARTEERRRHDTLMAQLMQRIPQIEAPTQEPPGAPSEATEQPGRVEPQPAVEGAQEPSKERRS
jgi:hypothetical protein